MKDNQEFIKDIYNKYEDYIKDDKQKQNYKTTRRKVILKNTFKILSAAAVILIVSTLIIDKDKSIKLNRNKLNNSYIPESTSLAAVGTFENFCEILKDVSSQNQYLSKNEVFEDAIQSETQKTESVKDYSKTNNQVANVEEADIVKTDGNNIYYISNGNLVIINVEEPENIKEVYKENYTDLDFYPTELYIKDDRLIVLGSKTNGTIEKEIDIIGYASNYTSANKAKVIIYDISNTEDIKNIREIETEGYILSSRMIGENLYVISNQYINTYMISGHTFEELDKEDYMPRYLDTLISKESNKIDFDEIQYFEDTDSANYLTIVGVNVNSSDNINIKTFLGSGELLYVSEENMYIAKGMVKYNERTREVENSSTKIFKFSLDDGIVNYRAETDIPGYINNQFSMDESNGTFKIAVTEGIQWNLIDATTNSLYILDDKMKEIGKLENLAKGEEIYSVRYTEKRAYIVTYEQVDPLFVIDISNPSDPKLLGELKVEGYSTYLHQYDENHLIGFGYDTIYNGKVTKTNGLKMVMFDVTDPSNPKELFNVTIGNNSTYSNFLYDHKALLYSKEKNIIGFPIKNYSRNTEYKAQIYKIDLEKGFTLIGEITQKNSNYNNDIQRIIYVGNNYYVLSNNEVRVIDMDEFKELDSLKF